MSFFVPVELRQQLETADGRLCVYCRTSADNTGQALTIDHIWPRSKGGQTEFTNICLAYRQCNEFKSGQVVAVDPLTGESVPLFHPRRDHWSEHFQWDETGIHLLGLTPIGRATIIALNINNEVQVKSVS